MKEVIVSRANATVKLLKKLQQRKYRELYGEYVAEGKRWVEDARKLCKDDIAAIVSSVSYGDECADFILSDELYAEVSDTEQAQGISAVLRIPPLATDFTSKYCLFLDRIRDPGNMGTILRTAVAAGYTDVILRDCVDVYSPKVVRSCMTGILRTRFHRCDDLRAVREAGYTVYAATLDGADVFGRVPSADKICLLIGNEANGIDPALLCACDRKVTIPMSEEMESLNAAVSAGILMYQLKFKS